MQLGMIGLGRMGGNMVRRLMRGGHQLVVYDQSAEPVRAVAAEGAQAALEEAVPAEVLAASLFARFRSRQSHTFGEKLFSAMRRQFGGHLEKPSREGEDPK